MYAGALKEQAHKCAHTHHSFSHLFSGWEIWVLIEFMAQRELHGEEAESGGKGIKLHNEISIRRWLKKCERAFSKGFYRTAAGKVCAVSWLLALVLAPPNAEHQVWVPAMGSKPRCVHSNDNGSCSQGGLGEGTQNRSHLALQLAGAV